MTEFDKATEVLLKLDGFDHLYTQCSCCLGLEHCSGPLVPVVSKRRMKYALVCRLHFRLDWEPDWVHYDKI